MKKNLRLDDDAVAILRDRIATLAAEREESLSTVAKAIGADRHTLSRLGSAPSLPIIRAAAQYFGVLTSYLVGEVDFRQPARSDEGLDPDLLELVIAKATVLGGGSRSREAQRARASLATLLYQQALLLPKEKRPDAVQRLLADLTDTG